MRAVFVKYNAVLRGVQSSVPFLRNMMVTLCCASAVAEQILGGAKMHEPARGTLTYEQAEKVRVAHDRSISCALLPAR